MLPEQDKQFPSGTHEAFTLEGNPTHVGIVMLMFFGNKGYFLEAELRLFGHVNFSAEITGRG